MLEIAIGMFELLSVATGLTLLLLATYVKFEYRVKVTGLRAVSEKRGGSVYFVTSSACGMLFSVAGLALELAGPSIIA